MSFATAGFGPSAFCRDLERRFPIKIRIDVNRNVIELLKIKVTEARGTGVGRTVMRLLTEYADAGGYDIILLASDTYGADIDRLVKFYSEFGFTAAKPTRFGVPMERRI